MSRLDDLSNSIKSSIEQIASRIQDSETFQKLNERFQGLTPQGQKIAAATSILVVVFIILYSPIMDYYESETSIAAFEDQRGLIKDLFKTYREANKDAGIASPPPSDMLINQINSQLQSNQLLPEQITSVNPGTVEGTLIPSHFVREVVNVNLAKLNLRQIVDIGRILTRLSESVKLKDMNVVARTDMNGYFDVTFKLYALNIPEMPTAPSSEPEPPSKRGKQNDSDSSAGSDE